MPTTCEGDPGLVLTTNSSTLSKVSGESGFDGVLAPLETSVPPSVLQLSNLKELRLFHHFMNEKLKKG